ncbi:hypothetical protein C8A01DRAFT_33415 [Parachaetomium inaequale]|uniref:NWD NACHT-NTPase N-terminal domain-containing protein n=1 Tax=Parachaetomium inaequale TaxID=2588326 RepID=A0AAN6PKB9_9PEZI|nr:hypothetical protein C8A01DRAFT_33415 [Parachaetomium inaequale]
MGLPRSSAQAAADSEDLWETAAAALGDDLKSAVEPGHADRRHVLEGVLFEATQKQKQCLEKRWKLKNRKGDVIILRDVFEKIITCANSFKGIGDSIANMGPGWAAIPWALVGVLLKVVVADNEAFAAMVEGLEKATKVISRYSIFEAVYLRNETAGTHQLRTSLVALYASVLTFLGESYRHFAKNTAKRFIKAFVSDSGVDDLLDDIAVKQAEVDRDALLVATETLQSTAQDIRGLSTHSTSVTSQLTLLETHLERIQQSQVVVGDFRALRNAISAMARPVQRVIANVPFTTDNLDVERRKAMLDWLSPVPYKLQHWSAVVDYELEEAEKHPASVPVAYFYCSRNTAEPERSDPVEILRCIARQLCGDDLSKPVPEQLRHVHEFLGAPSAGTANLPLDRTIQLILDLMKDNPATIIIDALDECDPGTRHQLFEALDEIVAKSENIAKIFLTSRNDGDIVCRLASTPNIYIDAQKNGSDIRRFIVTELEHVINKKQLLRGQVSHTLKQQITATLTDELGHLPKSLADLYAIAFHQVLGLGAESSKLATKALQILLVAFRPLSWAEFLYLLALSDDGLQPVISQDEVLHVTCNFIEADPNIDRVAFPHLSAREYLETRPEFDRASLHIAASRICLNGIQYPEPPGSGEPEMGFTYATLYLGSHLAKLSTTERPKVNLLERFLFLDPGFFARYAENIRRIMNCPRWYSYDVSQIPTMVVFVSADPLSMICLFGLEELLPRAVAQWSIEALYQPRLLGQSKAACLSSAPAAERLHRRSCLEAAVMLRHGSLLREMHTLGVSIDTYNDRGETPLHVACSQGLDDMIRLLVSLGADPNQMTRYPQERARAAPHFRNCFNGANMFRDPILRPFSSLGFRPGNAEGMPPSSFGAEKELQYPIHLAISLGKSIASVRALAEHGADPNARTSSGATALELCFEMGDGREEIVGFLLARGADPNAGVSMGRTTLLHIAAAVGLDRVVTLLIASGGDPARRDSFGRTPWDNATRYGHAAVLEALAAAGGGRPPERSMHSMLGDDGDESSEDFEDHYYYPGEFIHH